MRKLCKRTDDEYFVCLTIDIRQEQSTYGAKKITYSDTVKRMQLKSDRREEKGRLQNKITDGYISNRWE